MPNFRLARHDGIDPARQSRLLFCESTSKALPLSLLIRAQSSSDGFRIHKITRSAGRCRDLGSIQSALIDPGAMNDAAQHLVAASRDMTQAEDHLAFSGLECHRAVAFIRLPVD